MDNSKSISLVTKGGAYYLKIMCPYNRDDITVIKTLPDRRAVYEGRKFKYWICPFNIDSINVLKSNEFNPTNQLINFVEKRANKIDSLDRAESHIKGLKKELYEFQKIGVQFIDSRRGRCIIADEMGLGKTVQALAWLQLHKDLRPAIIVVPATLKLNWFFEANKWMTKARVQVLNGTTVKDVDPIFIVGKILIINYDILYAWCDILREIEPKVLITDECHYYKSSTTKRTRAIKKLAKDIPNIIQLSGTPIVNRPIEFFNAIKLVDDGRTGLPESQFSFAHQYCGASYTRFGWNFKGASNTIELHNKLTDPNTGIMLRRLKKDVLRELPDKTYSIIPFDIDNRKEYERAEDDFISWVAEKKGNAAAIRASQAEALAQLEGLKQIAVAGKLKSVKQWIRDFIDDNGKLVLFATHKFVINNLMEEFEGMAVKIDGSTSQVNRNIAVERFQNDDNIRLFIGNIKAAGVGITLTAASNVAILELPWTPGDLTQAEDRCHRIGQKDAVNVYYLIANETIEQRLASIIDRKRIVLNSVLDGREPEEGTLFSELMSYYL